MNRRHLLPPIILLGIFAAALFFSAYVIQNHPLPVDLKSAQLYYLNSVGQIAVGDPPVAFYLLEGAIGAISPIGASPTQVWVIMGTFFFASGAFTIYLLTKELTKSTIASLAASFFITFSSLSFLLVSFGYLKQSLAITLTPLALLLFWRGLQTERWRELLLSGILLGIVGLTHEIAFVCLSVAILGYVGFLLGQKREVPWKEIKACAVVLIPAAIIVSGLYMGKTGAILDTGGEGATEYTLFYGTHFSTPISNYSEPILFTLSIVGIGVILHTRSAAGFFVLAWFLSAIILTQPWIAYRDRFELQLILPMAILSSMTVAFLFDLLKESRNANQIIRNWASLKLLGVVGAILGLFFLMQAVTIVNFTGTIVRPLPIIDQAFNPLIFPISIIGCSMSGIPAVILKFIIGIPLTIAFWVLILGFTINKTRRAITCGLKNGLHYKNKK